jgi:hypothetical protein
MEGTEFFNIIWTRFLLQMTDWDRSILEERFSTLATVVISCSHDYGKLVVENFSQS